MSGMTSLLYAIRELTSRKGRSCGAIAGMSAGIALYVAFVTLSEGYRSLIQLPFSQLSVDVTIQRPSSKRTINEQDGIRLPFSNRPIEHEDVKKIADIPSIRTLSPSLLLWSRSPDGFVIIQGVDPTDTALGPARVQEWVVKGKRLTGKNDELLLEKHFARFNRKKVGESIRLGGRQFKIVGIVELKEGSTISSANAYVTIGAARELADLPAGASNMLFAKLKRGTHADSVRKEVNRILPGAIVSSADNIGGMMKGFNAISGKFSTTMAILSLVFAAIVTYRILAGSVGERAPEIGIMKAVGWTRNDITLTLVTETLVIGFLGGLAGVALGYLGALGLGSLKISLAVPWNLNPMPSGTGHAMSVSTRSVALPVVLSFKTVLVSLAVAGLTATLTGVALARKLSGLKVMEALRRV